MACEHCGKDLMRSYDGETIRFIGKHGHIILGRKWLINRNSVEWCDIDCFNDWIGEYLDEQSVDSE